jgi:hypothetical protein
MDPNTQFLVVMDKKTISRVLCGWLAIKEMEDVIV